MFHSLRMRMHQRRLQKALDRRTGPRQAISLEEAHVIGIHFNASTLPRREAVLAFAEDLQEQGKVVFKMGYFDSRLSDANFPFKHYNQRQIDWLFRPRSRDVNDFLQRSFDIFLNLESRTRIHSEFLAASCNAKFKVGPRASRLDIYDLMIESAPGEDEQAFIGQVRSILAKTNKRHEESEI